LALGGFGHAHGRRLLEEAQELKAQMPSSARNRDWRHLAH